MILTLSVTINFRVKGQQSVADCCSFCRKISRKESIMMLKRLIKWIKSCFAGSIAVSDQSRGKFNVDSADKRARDRGFRGKLNGIEKLSQFR